MTKNTEAKWALCVIVALALLLPSAFAIPLPSGVDGKIYDLDGVTEVPKGINYSVTNLNSGVFVTGKTGHGSPGKYAATISGNSGDTLLIRAWNNYNSANRTVTLQGVVHNADFVLNMTYPPLPPVLLTEFIANATEDESFSLQLQVMDENQDPLVFFIEQSPVGITVNDVGMITWNPTNDHVGTHTLSLRISDGTHIINETLSLGVTNVNDAPSIQSIPPTEATEDLLYQYQVEATDDDGDTITYSLVQSPLGMAITSAGYLSWTPTNSEVGTHTIVVQVSDGITQTNQSFSLTVINVNDLPVVVSLPLTQATQDQLYQYQVSAQDPDSTNLQYALSSRVDGMSISSTGLVRWTPNASQVGQHNITISVSDAEGSTTQQYVLDVANVNDPPVFMSTPPHKANAGFVLKYDPEVSDLDNDALQFYLLQGPTRVRLNDSTGKLRWKPFGKDQGLHQFILSVSDGNVSVNQSFNISVKKKNTPTIGPFSSDGGGAGGFFVPPSNQESTPENAGAENTPEQEAVQEKEFIEQVPKKLKEIFSEDELVGISKHLKKSEVVIYPDKSIKKVNKLKSRPKKTVQLDKKVYRYLQVEKETSNDDQPYAISFSVDREWMKSSNIKKNQVELRRHVDDRWEILETNFLNEEGDQLNYVAITPGFSYFAITVSEEAEPVYEYKQDTTVLQSVYTVAGIILRGKEKQVKEGTEVQIHNVDTNERLAVQTGIGLNTGAYSATIEATEGDTIVISVGKHKTEVTVGRSGLLRQDFVLQSFGSALLGITGNAILDQADLESLKVNGVIIVFIMVVTAIFISRKRLKNE